VEEDRAGEMLALGGDVEVSDPMASWSRESLLLLLLTRLPLIRHICGCCCLCWSGRVGGGGDRASFVSQTDEDLEPLWILS
jgi:hypothetical protein